MTPMLLRAVLKEQIIARKIGKSDEERMMFLQFADGVARYFIAPETRKNILFAIDSNGGALRQIYDELIDEIMALNSDSGAKEYTSRKTNQLIAINAGRLKEISDMYKRETGRDLSFAEIARFHMENARVAAAQGKADTLEPNPELMNVITLWQAAAVAKAHSASIREVIDRAAGRLEGGSSEGVQKVADETFRKLVEELGYCSHCVNQALQLIQDEPAAPPEEKN